MWRTRYVEHGLAGLCNEMKSGRPRNTSEEQIGLVNTALQSKPRGKTHWSRRGLAAEKIRDVVGLYLNSHDYALSLCVDEKSQVQALQRKQLVLPMGMGYVEGTTFDYIRHDTTTLFAAADIANGSVLSQCKAQHRHQKVLSIPRHIEANVPMALDVYLIRDNYGTHKHARVRSWLARRPRFYMHFTPTYSSWLNQVEC
jgi:DDE superfamily endonuclease